MKDLPYKYGEPRLLKEIETYIERTYSEHYSQDRIQATEFIIDAGHGEGFTIGNVIKYAQRYGKKEGKNRKDLLKVIHYAIMMLYIHDLFEENLNNATERKDTRSPKELFNNQHGNDVSPRKYYSGDFPIENHHWQGADTTGD
jgi:Protein of unknwon function (DUF3310)